jgi:hypothetical protein
MAVQHEPRHPQSTVSVSTVLPKTRVRNPRHGAKPSPPMATRATVKPLRPKIGDSARLWDYVKSEWIEGKIESIRPEYRIFVRCVERVEETVGWCVALREGAWVEDIVSVAATKVYAGSG